MKTFLNKRTGDKVTQCSSGYKTSSNEFLLAKWIEGSSDWEEILDLPEGTVVIDTFSLGYPDNYYSYTKQPSGKWKNGSNCTIEFTIDEKQIGDGKRFIINPESQKFQNVEIISFISPGGEMIRKCSNGLYYRDDSEILNPEKGASLEKMLEFNNPELAYRDEIYCVKRLSDGKLFKIGDICENNFTIKGFESKQGVIEAFNKGEYHTSWLPLSKLKLVDYLFKSDDGVFVKEGDFVYFVNLPLTSDTKIPTASKLSKEMKLLSDRKCFSNLEKAKDFIILNKPGLSIADVQEIYVSANEMYSKNTNRKDYFSALKTKVYKTL
jgi:hypothetical protein